MPVSLLAIVITYHPTAACKENILTYYNHVSEIILVDNTENDNLIFLKSIAPLSKIKIIKPHSNLGIAKALNMAMQLAVEKNYEFILTMDQDSYFEEPQIKQYLNCFQKLDASHLGMVGISYQNSIKVAEHPNCEATVVTQLITSGSIFTLNAFKKVNGFNENLFIDGVDHEFCLKLNLANLKVLSFSNIILNHNLGTLSEVKNWGFGKKVMRNTHAPIRLYYITRNYLYLNKLYKKQFPQFCSSLKQEILIKLKNGILYEKEKFKYLKYFFRGLSDYRKGKFGKLD